MTERISGVLETPSATQGGSGSAKDRRGGRRLRHGDDHDTVTISDEARRRSAEKEEDRSLSDEK